MSKKPEFKILPIEWLKRGKYQTRRDFNEFVLHELAESIKARGIIQPIVVRQLDESAYEIVAGERRWRASQLAQLQEVPCLINDYSDEQAVAATTIENINRENLNPIEEGRAYQRFIDDFGYVHEEIAAVVGKSRTHITNCLRLLKLDERIQQFLVDGKLSYGHGKVIAGIDMKFQLEIASRCIDKDWSVRKLENEVKKLHGCDNAGENFSDVNVTHLENEISEKLGAQVKIDCDINKKSGWLKIKYFDHDTFEGLLEKIGLSDKD